MKNETTIKVPKKYQTMIKELVVDFDGYRNQYEIITEVGYMFEATGTHVAFEETQADALKTIRTVTTCTCKDCVKVEETVEEVEQAEVIEQTEVAEPNKPTNSTIVTRNVYKYDEFLDTYVTVRELEKRAKIASIQDFVNKKAAEGFELEAVTPKLKILKKVFEGEKVVQYIF